ncbi:helix-turn-helix domain-containing protein [Streptomyces sp. NPDC093111]|uniref:helix-turn-helix domain-containing protein n=1 Tax=Streptomyces sp. NPDC093111 TaxID=3154978 RepID=UPI003423E20C
MTSDQVQSVRNAWINRLRDEALRMGRPEVSKAAHVGILIASYANADGSNAFPAASTLATIAGCSEETITRCVRLLSAVGLLSRRRRPNTSSVYQLVIPTQRPDWAAHMDAWGESRQAKARRKAKAAEIEARAAARTLSPDAVRTPSPAVVPDPVPGGVPNPSGTRPRTGPEPDPGRVPDPVPGGGDMFLSTCGRDPDLDHNRLALSPQPPTAGARENDAAAAPPPPRLVPPQPGGPRLDRSRAKNGSNEGQRALLLPVRTPPPEAEAHAEPTDDEIRQAIRDLGADAAWMRYGRTRVAPLLANPDPDIRTGT